MRKLFKERKLFKGGNYMRKYGMYFLLCPENYFDLELFLQKHVSAAIQTVTHPQSHLVYHF